MIDNAAREPEIVDICELLVEMGAQIGGVGSATLVIDGVEFCGRCGTPPWRTGSSPGHGRVWRRSQGDITIDYARTAHLEIALDKLVSAGAMIEESASGFRVQMERRPRAVDIVTLPYPAS